MKSYVRGRNIYFREIELSDSEFVMKLRTSPERSTYLSSTSDDVGAQRNYIEKYLLKDNEFYFIICSLANGPVGTIRIYDIQEQIFTWGSWILSEKAATSAGIESALLIYDFAFFALHLERSFFDVRKKNMRVVEFHKRFGAKVLSEDDLNVYFEYHRDEYFLTRKKYQRFLP